MVQSLLVYGTLLILMILLGLKSSRRSQKSFFQFEIILSLLLFAIVSGIRYDVGVDYLNYLDLYKDILEHPKLDYTENFEAGFIWILNRFADINSHFTWVFTFLAFIQIFFIYYAFKNERYLYPFLAFVIITGGSYFTLMNEIRQSIVLCIMIYAVRFANKQGILKYSLLVLLGLVFHSSAIFLIPIYIILCFDYDFFKSTKLQLLLLLSTIVLTEMFSFLDYFLKYVESISSLAGFGEKYSNLGSIIDIWQHDYSKGVRYYGNLFIFLIIIIYSKNLKIFFPTRTFLKYYNLFFIGAILYFLTYNNTLFQRPARYFTIMQVVISAYLLLYLWKLYKKKVVESATYIVLVLLHIIIFTAYLLSDHHTNYIFYWEAN